MRRAFFLALCCLLVAGCASRGDKSPAKADAGAPKPVATVPGPVQVVGRIVAVDLRTLTVIVELGPFVTLPADFATRPLVSRRDDLQPTARLQSSPYLRGRTLGTRLVAGRPQIGDEVVFPPPTQ